MIAMKVLYALVEIAIFLMGVTLLNKVYQALRQRKAVLSLRLRDY